MSNSSSLLSLAAFCFWLASSSLCAQEAEALHLSNAIERLSQISTRLASLNERLQIELRECRTNLSSLRFQLAASSLEMQTLERQLQDSKKQIEELESLNQISVKVLEGLRESQTKAESSLANLQTSLSDYTRKANAEILKWKALAGVGAGATVIAILVAIFKK